MDSMQIRGANRGRLSDSTSVDHGTVISVKPIASVDHGTVISVKPIASVDHGIVISEKPIS